MMQNGLSPEVLAMLACPVCHGALAMQNEQIHCLQCSRVYPIEDGIPILLADRVLTSPAS
jgi:hypothetical protein